MSAEIESSTGNEKLKSQATPQKKVILLGHSAGGTLALWIASKLDKLSEGIPIALCVAVAPIGDLEEGSRRKLSDEGDAINLYMGCGPSAAADCPYRLTIRRVFFNLFPFADQISRIFVTIFSIFE